MEFTAAEILARLKKTLRNEDTKIEGSFSMDNLQAVSEELARYNCMLIKPLWDEIDLKIEEIITSGNENHYVFWAKQVEDSNGNRLIGSARAYGVRDGSGIVYLSLITADATAPTQEVVQLVKEYIQIQRPVGARPIIAAAEAVEVSISGVVELVEGADLAAIQSRVQQDIGAYLAEIAFNGSGDISLNYHRIGIIIGAVQGVKDIMDYTINGSEESLTASYSQFFTLKGLVLNAS